MKTFSCQQLIQFVQPLNTATESINFQFELGNLSAFMPVCDSLEVFFKWPQTFKALWSYSGTTFCTVGILTEYYRYCIYRTNILVVSSTARRSPNMAYIRTQLFLKYVVLRRDYVRNVGIG